jgi:hypothetical protein
MPFVAGKQETGGLPDRAAASGLEILSIGAEIPHCGVVHTRSFPSGVFRSLTGCRGLGSL